MFSPFGTLSQSILTQIRFSDVFEVEFRVPLLSDNLIQSTLGFASQLGLDNDPNTTDTSGQPNNKGQIFIRIKANVGTTNNLETFSDFETLNFTWLEKVPTNQCDGLWLVGDAVVDAGWT